MARDKFSSNRKTYLRFELEYVTIDFDELTLEGCNEERERESGFQMSVVNKPKELL